MIRSAATEALGFLMTRDDAALPQCASKPGTRSNSRPPSPGRQVMRPANVPVKPRPEHGLVIDDQYGMDAPVYVPKREKTPATTVYDDGTIPDIDENNDEDAKTTVSRGSRRTALSDRSGASSRARSTLSQRFRSLGAKGFTFAAGGASTMAAPPPPPPKRPRAGPAPDGMRSENPQSPSSSLTPSPTSPSLSQMSVVVDAQLAGVPLVRGVPSLGCFRGREFGGDAIIASPSLIDICPNPNFAWG